MLGYLRNIAIFALFIGISIGTAHAGESGNISSYHVEGDNVTFTRALALSDIADCYGDPRLVCSDLIAEEKTVQINCNGGGDGGGWGYVESFLPEDEQKCFESIKICNRNGYCMMWDGTTTLGPVPTGIGVKFYPWSSNATALSAKDNFVFSQCDSASSHVDDQYKEHCIWSSDATASSSPVSKRIKGVVDSKGSTSGITGNTGDDMFRVPYDPTGGTQSAYIEYLDIDEDDEDRLQYITRDSSKATKPYSVMIPAGPRDTYEDYREFVNNAPAAFGLSAKDACYPVKARIACTDLKLPDVDGACGSKEDLDSAAALDVNTLTEGSSSALCSAGYPTDIIDDDLPALSWVCKGVGEGSSESCSYDVILDASCGIANEQYFSDLDALYASGDLCGPYSTKSGAVYGEGPWTWECKPNNSSGLPVNCVAFQEGNSCHAFFANDTMVFVQDLSGSFIDDLGNTVSAMKSLFNNSLFADWEVGLTSTYGKDGYASVYHKELDWTPISTGKDTLINKVESYVASTAYSEDPVYATYRALKDFYPRADGKTGTLIMITDEKDENSEYLMGDLADELRAKNLTLIVLATSSVKNYYKNFIDEQNIENIATVQQISYNSSDLAASLINGLIELGCKPEDEEAAE